MVAGEEGRRAEHRQGDERGEVGELGSGERVVGGELMVDRVPVVEGGDGRREPRHIRDGDLGHPRLELLGQDLADRIEDVGVVEHRVDAGVRGGPVEAIPEPGAELVLSAGGRRKGDRVHLLDELGVLVHDRLSEQPITTPEVVVDEGGGEVEFLADVREDDGPRPVNSQLSADGVEQDLTGVSVSDAVAPLGARFRHGTRVPEAAESVERSEAMEPGMRIELTTYALRVRCSTD